MLPYRLGFFPLGVGDNRAILASLGVDSYMGERHGLVTGNFLAGLYRALTAQYQGSADIGMGTVEPH